MLSLAIQPWSSKEKEKPEVSKVLFSILLLSHEGWSKEYITLEIP